MWIIAIESVKSKSDFKKSLTANNVTEATMRTARSRDASLHVYSVINRMTLQIQQPPSTMDAFTADPMPSAPPKQAKKKASSNGAKKGEPLPGTPIFLRVSSFVRTGTRASCPLPCFQSHCCSSLASFSLPPLSLSLDRKHMR